MKVSWKHRLAVAGTLILHSLGSVAQPKSSEVKPASLAGTPDAAVQAIVKEVSADRIRATITKLASFKNRNTVGSANADLEKQGIGIVAASKWIESELKRYSQECGGCLEVKTDSFVTPVSQRILQPTTLTNVYAVLKGTDPQNAGRMYLVTGHYDSFFAADMQNVTDPAPGANDDASGAAVSLECARVLSKHKFPATLIFLTVAGEEQGLLGSEHFAKMAKSLGWDLEGVLNNDIVGGNTTPGDVGQRKDVVRVFSEGVPDAATDQQLTALKNLGGENDSASRQLARFIRQAADQYLPRSFQPYLVYRRDRYLRGGDHTSFNKEGFAAVRFTEWREDFHHQHQKPRIENGVQYGDLLEFVDFDYVANVARVNAATLAELASSPAPPANVRLQTQQLENDSTIKWDAAPGGMAAGYEVLMRATDSPNWESARDAGNGTQVTVPESKDNVIFAIRSVDAKGHHSLPVLPVPERRQRPAPGTPAGAGSGPGM
jgi:hypothetical protein